MAVCIIYPLHLVLGSLRGGTVKGHPVSFGDVVMKDGIVSRNYNGTCFTLSLGLSDLDVSKHGKC